MNETKNQQTQPHRAMRIFNNWSTVARAWYAVCRARDVRVGQTLGVVVARQHLVVFRGASGEVYTLDGYCPHMGTDLTIGTVVGDELRCFFHHWRFRGDGACTHIPAQEEIPPRACTQGWATQEAYGMIWVFPDRTAPFDVPTFYDLPDHQVHFRVGRPYKRLCHHHVCMINGIDVQHLSTVHNIDLDAQVDAQEDAATSRIDFLVDGRPPTKTWLQRQVSKMLGGRYSYHMRYSAASIGLLTTTNTLKLFDRIQFPKTRMLFGYTPREDGTTTVWPVFIAQQQRGLLGKIWAESLLALMYLGFLVLRDADGKVYDNMRFNTSALIARDRPLARFFAYVNRLEPSAWNPVVAPTTPDHEP